METKMLASSIKSSIKKIYPVYSLWTKTKNREKFSNESLLLKGQHKTENQHPTALVFTSHKCASVYVAKILKDSARDVGMTPIDLDGYFWDTGKPESEVYADQNRLEEVIKPVGYLYCPFRKFIDIPKLEKYRILLMLRDPRDVLTSLYFSSAYSHADSPALGVLKDRQKALGQTIDEFVIDKSDLYLQRYRQYCQNLFGKPNVLFVKYEEMVTDFNTWFNKVTDFLELNVSQKLVNQIASTADFKVEKEDIYAHKRQVMPGEHKRKLKPETISLLNSKFHEVLSTLDYAKTGQKC